MRTKLLSCLVFALATAALYADEPIKFTLQAVAGMQFDQPRLAVKPGARVALTLTNTDNMLHNLVVTQPAKRMDVVMAAIQLGARGPELHYVPPIDDVITSTRMLGPGESQTITFDAPKQAGVYPYVCTFPGHGFLMFGALYVGTEMPPLADDPHVPKISAATIAPVNTRLPAVSRTLLRDASPAAIAVGLPGGLSYCWDAGVCRLRYAWSGGFVDNTPQWSGAGTDFATPIGRIGYRASIGMPIHITDHDPAPQFLGYRLIDRHPEFEYRISAR